MGVPNMETRRVY